MGKVTVDMASVDWIKLAHCREASHARSVTGSANQMQHTAMLVCSPQWCAINLIALPYGVCQSSEEGNRSLYCVHAQ